MPRCAVLAVRAEVAQTHKLIGCRRLGALQTLFHLTAGEHLQRLGIQTGEKILACGIRVGIVKEVGVLMHLGFTAVICIHPVDGCALNLPSVGGIAALGVGVIGGKYFNNIAVFVGIVAGAGDYICALEPTFGAGGVEPLIL